MKIVEIKATPVAVRYTEAFQHDKRFYPKAPTQTNVLVELVTDEGISGIGECAHAPGIYGENHASTLAALDYLRPVIVDRDPMAISAINIDLDRMSPIQNIAAKAGIDVALHDLVGKALGVPVYQLLGGRVHDKLPTHISPATYEDTRKDVERLLKQGFRIFKQKMSGNTEYDVGLIFSLLDILPDDATVSLDANQGWSVNQTLEIAGRIERRPGYRSNSLILEQPIRGADFTGLRRIRDNTSLRVMADDGIRTIDDLHKILHADAADIVSLKISRVGGIQKCQQMIKMAEAANVDYIVDEINELRVANTAVAHLALASKSPIYTGTTCHLCLEHDIVTEGGVIVKEGYASLGTGAGLGITGLDLG